MQMGGRALCRAPSVCYDQGYGVTSPATVYSLHTLARSGGRLSCSEDNSSYTNLHLTSTLHTLRNH